MVVAMVRCRTARRPPYVVLSVDFGSQLEEEPGGVEVAHYRCFVERARSFVHRLVHIGPQFCEEPDRGCAALRYDWVLRPLRR